MPFNSLLDTKMNKGNIVRTKSMILILPKKETYLVLEADRDSKLDWMLKPFTKDHLEIELKYKSVY